MSLIKKLIQRLLDSRTTPEEAGHSAMPTTTEITSQSFAGPFSSWGPVASGTASEDGYIYAAGAVATSGSNSEFRLDNGQFGSYITSTWGTQGLLLPVMKGQFWRLYAANRKDVVIRLYRLVGGGYKGFIRRALSCLRALSNYSPRSSFRTNPNGLRPKAFQKGGYSCHLSLLNMSLPTMDTLAFTKTLQTQENLLMFMPLTQLIQFLQGFAWALLKDLLHTQKLFLLEKVARLLSLRMQIRSKNYGFRRLSAVINNLGVGGALC